jgi:hypothetical protein
MARSIYDPEKDTVDEIRREYDAQYKNQYLDPYNIGTYEYPEGLRVKPDLQHYVAFFVNVRQKSNITRNRIKNRNKDYLVDKRTQREIDAIATQRSSTTGRITQGDAESAVQTAKEYAGRIVAGATLIGAGLTSGIKGVGKALIPATLAGGATAVVTNMIDNLGLQEFDSGRTVRLKDVITLNIEERPSVKYGVNYTNTDVAGLLGLGGIFIQGSAALTAKNLKSAEPELQARFLSELARIPALSQGGGLVNNLRELSSRTKTNPFRETLFESVDYRSFTFRYRFFPKNASESNKIKNIIKVFKTHMHPELTAQRLFYIYPSEFDIQYFYKDKENNYLHSFTRCALTDMTVDYGGEQFSTFQDGAPVEVLLSLTFTELENLTSEAIDEYGY